MLYAVPRYNVEECPPGLVVRVSGRQNPLADSLERQVQAIWDAEQTGRDKPMLNGELLSLTGRSGNELHGCFLEYQWFVAQRNTPALVEHLRVRPLAVAGLVICADGVVFGQRAHSVTQFPGYWELVPSGGIDHSKIRDDRTINYIDKLVEEFVEETGCPAEVISGPQPFALVEDCYTHVIDIGVQIKTDLSRKQIQGYHKENSSHEYKRLQVVSLNGLQEHVIRNSSQIVGTSLALLCQVGLIDRSHLPIRVIANRIH
jgi:hypothetical protein